MLSEVPEGWTATPFELLATLQSGFAFKSANFVDDDSVGLPIIRIRDLEKQSPVKFYDGDVPDEYIVEKGDVLIGMDGEFNCVEWRANSGALNQRVLRVYETEKTARKFLMYRLIPILKDLEGKISGTTVKHLSVKHLKALSIPTPPRNEQHRIAEILSSVDASIQATQAVIEQAERVKRGLMEELLTGGLGSEAIERGEVPEGWRRTTIGALCKVVTGKTPSTKKEEYWNGEVPFFSPADLSEAATVAFAERTITGKALTVGAKLLPANSILYTCIGSTIGKVAIATVECCTNQQINACVVNEGVDYRFLYFQLLMAESVVKSLSSTTAVPIINKTAFSSIEIVLPAAEEQHRIAEKLASFDSVIEKEQAIIEQLRHAKSGLMDDLLTGKVRTV